MSNADQMEEVMYRAHKEGIVQEMHVEATSIRENSSTDFYNSYIMAYESLHKVKTTTET